MSTFKTVLTTASVPLLGSILLGLGAAVWTEQQEIQALQIQVAGTQADVSRVQNQTYETTSRLNKTIKTANQNFSRLKNREDKMSEVIAAVCKLILSGSGQDPARYRNPNTSGE